MKLVLFTDKYKFRKTFYPWLVDYIKTILLGKVDYNKLTNFENIINQDKEILGPFKKHISGKDIFISGVDNIILKHFDNTEIYQIDPNAIFPGTQEKVITLCKMINYGTLDFEPYPIFTDTFKYIETNIKVIYKIYMRQQKNV